MTKTTSLLHERLSHPLVREKSIKFDPDLVDAHKHLDHKPTKVKKNTNMYDVLGYIYENAVKKMADTIQSYLDGVENTHEIFATISLGLDEGYICLDCVKNMVKKAMQ